MRALLGKCCGIYYCILYSYFQVLKHIQRVLQKRDESCIAYIASQANRIEQHFLLILSTQILRKKRIGIYDVFILEFIHSLRYFLFISLIH